MQPDDTAALRSMFGPPPSPLPTQLTGRASRRHWLAQMAGGLAWFAPLATGLGACSLQSDVDHAGPDAPDAAPLAQQPRVAWVFSSGGPRGFVHVGVLKALDELGLQPDLVVGASVGALVGVLWAGGHRGRALEALALDLQPWEMADLAVGAPQRFSGAPLAQWVRNQLPQPRLEQLAVPTVCVAKRLADGGVVGFNRGDAGLAVQAAAAIEGQFTPVRIRGQRLADADLATPLPVRLARALGARQVLAVDASAHESRAPAGAERYRAADLRKRALTQPDADAATLLLHPDFGYWVSMGREFRQRCIDAGYRDAMAAAPQLRAMHALAASG